MHRFLSIWSWQKGPSVGLGWGEGGENLSSSLNSFSKRIGIPSGFNLGSQIVLSGVPQGPVDSHWVRGAISIPLHLSYICHGLLFMSGTVIGTDWRHTIPTLVELIS